MTYDEIFDGLTDPKTAQAAGRELLKELEDLSGKVLRGGIPRQERRDVAGAVAVKVYEMATARSASTVRSSSPTSWYLAMGTSL